MREVRGPDGEGGRWHRNISFYHFHDPPPSPHTIIRFYPTFPYLFEACLGGGDGVAAATPHGAFVVSAHALGSANGEGLK